MNHGAAAEGLAASFLTARGLLIVQRNYRCRGGEIDLIVRDGETLVFVAVLLDALETQNIEWLRGVEGI